MTKWGVPFVAGRVGWVYRGEWDGSERYSFLDVVRSEDVLYLANDPAGSPLPGKGPAGGGGGWTVIVDAPGLAAAAATAAYPSIVNDAVKSVLSRLGSDRPAIHTLVPGLSWNTNVSYFWKDALGHVHIMFRCAAMIFTKATEDVYIMPQGYTPRRAVYGAFNYQYEGVSYIRDSYVGTDGTLRMNIHVSANIKVLYPTTLITYIT